MQACSLVLIMMITKYLNIVINRTKLVDLWRHCYFNTSIGIINTDLWEIILHFKFLYVQDTMHFVYFKKCT